MGMEHQNRWHGRAETGDEDIKILVEMLQGCRAPLWEFIWPSHLPARMLRDMSIGDSHTAVDEETGELFIVNPWPALNGGDWNIVSVRDKRKNSVVFGPDTL